MEKATAIQSPSIRIKVVGVGGGGNSVLERLVEDGITNVELIAVNTDARDISYMKNIGVKTVQIGKNLTNGYGTGGNFAIGEQAAEEDEENLKEIFRDAEIVFLTAGLGGGAGTGAIPVMAKLARELDILCVGIVTLPFAFEGKKRRQVAEAGLAKAKDDMDALIVIENDSLLKLSRQKLSIEQAFKEADSILRQGIQLIFELIMKIGSINTDFADLRVMLRRNGKSDTILGIGESESGSVVEAVQQTLESPLLNRTLKGARAVIFNVVADESLELFAVQEAMDYIREQTQTEETDIFFGTVNEEGLGNKVRIMLIAADFAEDGEPGH